MRETTQTPRSIRDEGVLYKDLARRISKVVAQFDGFQKEYYVADYGVRSGMVVCRNDELLLTRQYRLLINRVSREIPGGSVDEGETPEAAAIRECEEETGVRCRDLERLMDFQLGLDIARNPTHIFLCRSFDVPASGIRENCEWVPAARCMDMVFTGEIADCLSIIAIMAYHSRFGSNR